MPRAKKPPARLVVAGQEFHYPAWIVGSMAEGQGAFKTLPLALACAEDIADERGEPVEVVSSPTSRGHVTVVVNPQEVQQ